MTISSIITKQSFECNGSLREFDFNFTAISVDDIKALIRDSDGVDTELTALSQYSVTLNPDGSGGTLTTVATWALGNTLIVYRETSRTQETEYKNNQFFDQEILEKDLDKIVMVLQEDDKGISIRDIDAAIIACDTAVTARDAAVTARDTAVTARDAAVTARDTAVTARDAAVTARDTAVTARDAAIIASNAAEDFKNSASGSASSASSSAEDAANAAAAAEETAGAEKWVAGMTYAIGDVVWSPINYRAYRRKTDGAGTIDPSSDAINWTALLPFATAAEITAGTEAAKAIAPDQLALSKYNNWSFATAAEITAGLESAKAIAPDQLALTKYNGDWSFWGIKNLRLVDVYSGDHTKVKVNPSAYNIPILIGDHWHVMTSAVTVSSVDDLDTGSLAAGTDYYIYACTDGTTLSFKVSANATNPTGFDAAHSRKIGGFHTLCVAVGAIGGHTLTGYAQKDILPASIWDLKHRAKNLVNVGLVYDSAIQKWVDIYLASGTGANTTSVNGGTISDTRNWMDFVDDGLAVGKRLLTDTEFTSIATGSNEETNITGSADPGTTSGHVDTAGRRMISNIGCEDCCGVVWQWIQDQSYYYYGSTGYWGNLPGGKGSSHGQFAADPAAAEVDNNDTGGDVKLFAGGNWSSAACAGSRSRNAAYYRWVISPDFGARFVSEPL